MKYIGVRVATMLLVALALSTTALASSAFAGPTFTLAFWFRNNVELTEDLAVTSTAELLLEDQKVTAAGGAAVATLCSFIADGFLGPNSFDEVKEILNLAGTAISTTALTGTSLACTRVTICESGKVWAVNLPWRTELEKWTEGANHGFVDLFLAGGSGKPPGWYAECTVLGIKAEDECTSTSLAAEVTGAGVYTWSEAITLLFGSLAKCTGSGGMETGNVEGTSEGSVFTEGGKVEEE
jgi:hypothetical protein